MRSEHFQDAQSELFTDACGGPVERRLSRLWRGNCVLQPFESILEFSHDHCRQPRQGIAFVNRECSRRSVKNAKRPDAQPVRRHERCTGIGTQVCPARHIGIQGETGILAGILDGEDLI